MSLLSVNNLSVSYTSGIHTTAAVQDISFSLESGKILGIVGESGAGKSTIGLAISGLLAKNARITQGNIFLNKDPLHSFNEKNWRALRGKQIGSIFQEHGSSLNPLLNIEAHLRETLQASNPGLGITEIEERIDSLLNEVGIKNISRIRNSYPHQLSGGQRQRVVIALALSGNPKLLIADEPVTALDVSIQYQILLLLDHLRRSQNLAILVITHNIGVVSQIADTAMVMKDGSIVEYGDALEVLTNPKEAYSKMLLNSVPKILVSKSSFNYSTSPYISLENISHTYKGNVFSAHENKKTLDSLNFHIHRGESVGILGESGSGKTTIARLLTGIQRVQMGDIRIADTVIPAGKRFPKNLRVFVQMVFQDPYSSLNPKLSIKSHLAEAIRAGDKGLPRKIVHSKVKNLLEMVELPLQSIDKYPREFSGGQKQRIAIARALAVEPKLLICDEPTSALDVSVQKVILDLLKSLQQSIGFTLIFISHDLPVVQYMCDSIAVLYNGCFVEHTNAIDLFHEPQHAYTQELVKMIPQIHWQTN